MTVRTGPPLPLDAAPGPQPADMLREARRMVRDPLGYLVDVVARYGPAVAFPMPRTPVPRAFIIASLAAKRAASSRTRPRQ